MSLRRVERTLDDVGLFVLFVSPWESGCLWEQGGERQKRELRGVSRCIKTNARQPRCPVKGRRSLLRPLCLRQLSFRSSSFSLMSERALYSPRSPTWASSRRLSASKPPRRCLASQPCPCSSLRWPSWQLLGETGDTHARTHAHKRQVRGSVAEEAQGRGKRAYGGVPWTAWREERVRRTSGNREVPGLKSAHPSGRAGNGQLVAPTRHLRRLFSK